MGRDAVRKGAPQRLAPEQRAWDDEQVRELFRKYRATEDRALRNELIERHHWLALTCANRFAKRGEPTDDLLQVAQLGVLKAVMRFDPDYGTSFAAFAMPTVLGELKRHFRDNTWSVRVPRRLQELHLDYKQAVESLTHELRRPPRVGEIAAYLRLTVDEVLEAMDAGSKYRGVPLTPPSDDDTPRGGDQLGGADPELDQVEGRLEAQALLDDLPPRERTIVYLWFYEGQTQSQIAERLGISQVHVSRLLRGSLARLQARHAAAAAAATEPT